MKKLLVIADSPTCNTGFATVTRNVLENLPKNAWDISIIGVNYYGDPHPMQNVYRIYNPAIGNDIIYGFGRIKDVMQKEQPALVWILNDIWLAANYIQQIRSIDKTIPIVVYTPIDSEHIKREFLVSLFDPNVTLITYTEFAKNELVKSGYKKNIYVIPHGVDTSMFYPMEQSTARQDPFGSSSLANEDPFIVLYVGRNQPRKRVDSFIYIVAEWIKRYNRENVYMHYHGATHDIGIDVEDWAQYLGVDNRLILTAKNLDPGAGIPLEKLKYIYNSADVYFHACAVEGWGMPVHEAMACGIPVILPDYSALSDWPTFNKTVDSVEYIKVNTDPVLNNNGINTIHRMVNTDAAIEALEKLYQDKERRKVLSQNGFKVATDDRYMWSTISKQFHDIFIGAVNSLPEGLKVWKRK